MGTSRTTNGRWAGLLATLACAMALAAAVWPGTPAWAGPGAQSSRSDAAASASEKTGAATTPASDDALVDTAGNVFSASRLDGSDNGETTGVLEVTQDSDADFLWAGYALELADSTAAGDILAAGRTVTLRDSAAGSSVRVAAQGITLANVTVGRNATLAAQNVYVNGGTSIGGAAYIAAQSAKFAGGAKSLFVMAQTVTISGTVDGDAYVYASDVRVEEGAVITGTLYVEGASEPSVAGSAQIGTLDAKVTSDDAVVDVAEPSLTDTVFAYALSAAACAVGALLLALVLPGTTCGGARMLRTRAGYVLLSGFLGTMLALPTAVALLVLLLSAQMGVALLGALGVLLLTCEPLVAAALMGALFPRMNRFGAALVGGLVWGALMCAPYAGVIVTVVSLVLAIGMAIQAVWLQLRRWQGVRAGGETAGDGPAAAPGSLPGAGEDASAAGSQAQADGPTDDGRPVPPPEA